MNPEKYKNEMSRKYPDRAFAEEVLARAKKTAVPEKKNHRFLKAAGGIGLSAAVLVGTFAGAGAVRSLFKDINREDSEITGEIKNESPVISEEISEEADRITATEDILAATPLSNPKYTVKANTPDGKVSLDEHTTVAEMVACGVPVNTDNGILGIEYLCEAFRKYRSHEAFEFIIGDARTFMGANTYHYYNYDPAWKNYDYDYYAPGEGCTYWFYDHRYGQSISKFGQDIPFADMRGGTDHALVAITTNTQLVPGTDVDSIGIATFYDTFGVTGYDKELRKEMYYADVTYRADTGYPPFLNLIYNGQCVGKYRMNLFLERIENGAEYAGVQFTDITTTDEYDERLYSVEYCQGVYSIFTMTDGLDGKYDTQYFDSYTLNGNTVVFDNGNVQYSFMLSENVEVDVAQYGDVLNDNHYAGYAVGVDIDKSENLKLYYDVAYVNGMYKEKISDIILIDEAESTEEFNAVRVISRNRHGSWDEYKLYLQPDKTTLGKGNNGDIYCLSEVICAANNFNLDARYVEKNGNMYLMLTDGELEKIKDSEPNTIIHYGESILNGARTWIANSWVNFGEE